MFSLRNRKKSFRRRLKHEYGSPTRSFHRTFSRHAHLIQNRKPKSRFRKILILFFILVIIGISSWAIFFSDIFLIREITVSEDENDIADNTDQIRSYVENAYGKNLLTLKTEEIRENVLNSEPNIQSLKIKKVFPHTLKIEFAQYPMAANLINTVKDGTQQKFLLNTNGYATQENLDNPNLPYMKTKTEEPLKKGDQVLDQKKLEYILSAIQYFEEKFGMKIIEIQYLNVEREVHLKTEKQFYIWLDMNIQYQKQLDKLRRVTPKLDYFKTPLEYIDLRISGTNGDKIIYKKRPS